MSEPIISAQDVRFSYVTAEGVAPIVLGGVSWILRKAPLWRCWATTAAASPRWPST